MNLEPMDELRSIAAAVGKRRAELGAVGIDFHARASRRLSIRGITYRLILEVLPETGLDNFAWDAFFRPWTASAQQVEDVGAKANQVLDSYVAGDRPPAPGFG